MKLFLNDLLSIRHSASSDAGKDNTQFTGVSTDSRLIQPARPAGGRGNLFFALRGEKFDGHDFITKAISSGAAAVVVDRRWADLNIALYTSLSVPRVVVEDTTHALGDLARVYRRKFRIPVLAVAGSNGKTTTKEMIHAVLRNKYHVLSTEGNLNNHIGLPQTLLRLEAKHHLAVVEMGTNHPGEIARLCEIAEPTHGLITNIGSEHLEFFKTLRGVAKAEGELFDWLREHGKRSNLFANYDDKHLVELSKKQRRKITYGFMNKKADVVAQVASTSSAGAIAFTVKPKGKKAFLLQLNVPGSHNAMNALAAVTVGLWFKVPQKKIQSGLESFTASSKRMEVFKIDGITILNDTYNSNPDSVLAALQTIKAMDVQGKRIAFLADMLELGLKGEDEHRKIGKVVAKHDIEYLLTFGSLSRFTHEAASTQFKAHYEQKNILVEYLAELITKGDVVLVKGSRGMRMEDVVTFLKERIPKAA